ncbi:Uncharacterised protein [Mycobacterium tuberculosis]|uniref:Uncharacterized protein n=1 Tax=Mycobacterium tuberculosis TaxID=1773 RepID=A0A916LAA1_MYCTX|nr:Uncharacterised protein [Mycobacterium tuberculosis]
MWRLIRPSNIGAIPLAFQYFPRCSQGSSSVQMRSMISSASRVISRCSPFLPSTSYSAQSPGMPLAPTPSMNRPWARWSK